MNKRMEMTLSVVAVMFLIAACGSTVDQTVTVGENAVPEMSSGEMLVDGLEYLLSEDKEDIIQIPETEDTVQDTGTGKEDAAGEDKAAVSDNRAEEPEQVEFVIYYSNGTFDSLDSAVVEADEMTAETIISALARRNIVSLDTKVLSFEEEEIVGGSVLYLDLSGAINEYLRTMTREAESIIIASITDTFLENYGADAIYITVEGEPLKTPYDVYDKALKKCLPQDLMEAEEGEVEEESENVGD